MRASCTLAALSKAVEHVRTRAAQAPREERGVRAHQEQNNASVPKKSSTAASVNALQLEVLICTSHAPGRTRDASGRHPSTVYTGWLCACERCMDKQWMKRRRPEDWQKRVPQNAC